jgi:hypothetical protein
MASGFGVSAGACPVCGVREVECDAVELGGKLRAASGTRAETSSWLLLAECPCCDHRWTQALRDEPMLARVPRRAAVRLPEVASAA